MLIVFLVNHLIVLCQLHILRELALNENNVYGFRMNDQISYKLSIVTCRQSVRFKSDGVLWLKLKFLYCGKQYGGFKLS